MKILCAVRVQSCEYSHRMHCIERKRREENVNEVKRQCWRQPLTNVFCTAIFSVHIKST